MITLDTPLRAYHIKRKKPHLVNDPLIGIELEYENWRDTDTSRPPPRWQLTNDPSLRNNGIELISKPLSPKTVHDDIEAVVKWACKSRIDAHERCGTHVHLNQLPYTYANIWSLTMIYTLLEPYIFAKWAPRRQESHFCVPLFNNTVIAQVMGDDITELRRGIEPPVIQKKRTKPQPHRLRFAELVRVPEPRIVGGPFRNLGLFNTNKYSALNFSRMLDLGTVEFRMFPSTVDAKLINTWIDLILDIQEYGNKFKDPIEIVYSIEDRGENFILERFGLADIKVNKLDKEDALDTITLMAGYEPTDWKTLDWDMEVA